MGLPSYNDMRGCFGFARAKSFADLGVEDATKLKMEGVYGSVDLLDVRLFVSTPGSSIFVGLFLLGHSLTC
jgi:hypothetical protein